MSITRAAQVQDGVVRNIIMVSLDDNGKPTFKSENSEDIVLLPDDVQASAGWTYKDGQFAAPEPIELDMNAVPAEATPSFQVEGQPLEVAEQDDFQMGAPVEPDTTDDTSSY